MPAGRRRGTRDRGTVTAELAVALPGVVVVSVALVVAGQAVVTEVRCTDAARAAARAAARGDPAGAVVAEARLRAPAGAHVTIAGAGDLVRVEVTAPVRGLGAGWAGLTAKASASSTVERAP